ncbi:MAG: hypothetical protein BalsKO_26550 [Balneolaceae bacterium]
MLRLFRNTRQKLIEQDNVRKYIWYAVGEILLVMVGILLALQVNNWNEGRKLVQEEEYIIQELINEFDKNLTLLQRDYRGNKATLDATNDLMEMFLAEKEDFSLDHLDSLLVTLLMNTSFDPSTGVVEEIISTGRLSVLRDDSLRYLITQWPSVLRDQQEDIEIRSFHFQEILLPAISRMVPIKNSNRYFDFEFWSDTYERVQLSRSAFKFETDKFFTLEMEGYLFVHSVNQDYILMNDLNTEEYINQILDRLKEIN